MKSPTLVMRTIAVVCFLTSSSVFSQPNSGQDPEQYFRDWIASASEFVSDVTFNESDVESFLRYWGDLETLGMEDEEEDTEEDLFDFASLLSHPEYEAWARAQGLAPESWMRKSMRIMLMLMREQFQEHMAEAEEDLPEQLKLLEEQRSQMGEEMYQQMKQAIESSAAMMKTARGASSNFPQPTAVEQKALDKHRAALMAMMEGEEGDEDSW